MMRMTENGYERPSPHSRAIQTEGLDVCLDRREQATAFKEQIDSVRSWHERVSPKFRRLLRWAAAFSGCWHRRLRWLLCFHAHVPALVFERHDGSCMVRDLQS